MIWRSQSRTQILATGPFRVCVIGAIGVHKGFQVLLDCARDADARDLPLEFVVVGHTIDDRALLATGRVFVTGPYAVDEAVALIKSQHARLALLPSIFPETWCFTLGEAWQAGLRVVAFDLGAQAGAEFAEQAAAFYYHLGFFLLRLITRLVAEAGSTSA